MLTVALINMTLVSVANTAVIIFIIQYRIINIFIIK